MNHLPARAVVLSLILLDACTKGATSPPEPTSPVAVTSVVAPDASRVADAADDVGIAAGDAGPPDAQAIAPDASSPPADDYEEDRRIESGLSDLQDRMRVCLTKAKIESASGVGLVLRIDRSGAVREAKIGGRAHLWNDQTITPATAECFLDLARHARFGPLRREHPEEHMMAP